MPSRPSSLAFASGARPQADCRGHGDGNSGILAGLEGRIALVGIEQTQRRRIELNGSEGANVASTGFPRLAGDVDARHERDA